MLIDLAGLSHDGIAFWAGQKLVSIRPWIDALLKALNKGKN